MQAFSSMQRNSIDLFSLRFLGFALALCAYEMASAVNQLFPPFLGLIFAYLLVLKNESVKSLNNLDKRWYLALIFMIFAEQIHGFKLFSSVLGFIIFYYLINDKLLINMKCRVCLLVIFVFSGYAGAFLMTNLIFYLLNEPNLSLKFGFYLYYIVIEAAIAVFLFKARVL